MISLYKTTLGYMIPVSIVIGLFFIFIISPIFAQENTLAEIGERLEEVFKDNKSLTTKNYQNKTSFFSLFLLLLLFSVFV